MPITSILPSLLILPLARRKASAGLAAFLTVFLAGPSGRAQTFSALHEFQRGAEGAAPSAGLVRDAAGNLYGTAVAGGSTSCFSGCGVVFEVSSTGTETVLYSFLGSPDGSVPTAGLLRDRAGNLYGTTQEGGSTGCGTIFKVDTKGKETILHNFTGGASDGCGPDQGVIRDGKGNLFGSTYAGGDLSCYTGGCGVVFKLSPSGKETVLHKFSGRDGAFGGAGFLVLDSTGNLYGTAGAGGTPCPWNNLGCGVVFRLSKTGKETVLYKFTGHKDGRDPVSGVLRDAAGNLYGTASEGGDSGCNYGGGCGVVFKLAKTGKMTVLHTFKGFDGAIPYAGLIQDAAGNFYGTTTRGGGTNEGAVFKLGTNGKVRVLHNLTGFDDGYLPVGQLVRDGAGNVYGTAPNGGTYSGGVVFKIAPR